MEDDGEYVLQWDGHAGHVTERFSGLLARQALVDVTLICDEQKLRVHKLVLASCSLYFEEMLEQDLGQEPIIVLSDLNFEVLKAMVEFMYCGETTISQQHLEPLLHAARIFKVKELASIADNMMGSQNRTEDQIENSIETLVEDTHESDDNNGCILFDDSECVQTTVCEELVTDKSSNTEVNVDSDIELETTYSLQSDPANGDGKMKLEPTLYEESCGIVTNEMEAVVPMETAEPLTFSCPQGACESNTDSFPEFKDISSTVRQDPEVCIHKDESTEGMKNDSVTICDDGDDVQPMLYEQCCDFSINETFRKERNQSPLLLPTPCPQREPQKVMRSSDSKEIPSTVGKCLKVYTHKRRKSSEGMRSRLPKLTDIVPEAPSSSCIDLTDELSSSDTPVTLPTSLEMESTDYILSLSTEHIESVEGCAATETSDSKISSSAGNVNDGKDYPTDIHKELRQMKEIFSDDNRILAIERPDTVSCKPGSLNAPALRRSVRLNQQESDDSANNNSLAPETHRTKERATDSNKKDHSGNNTEIMTRLKRKAREPACMPEPCESDENMVSTSDSAIKCSNIPRSLRSTSKFLARNGGKARLSMTRNNRSDLKPKTNSKLKPDKLGKSGRAKTPTCLPMKFNTIASVSRALWGDMSDFLESRENGIEFPDYSPSKEIPFAVGLLPLRAALERMQAMPDYQPRKTRSSVTPLKHELNGVKRKNCSSGADSSTSAKRQNTPGNSNNINGNTFCHVHITTSPPQAVRTRRRLLPEQVATLAQTNIAGRR